jgi:hypothetical protein
MLYPTPEISAEDVRVLAEIDVMRQELRNAIRDTPAKWTDGLRKFLTADAISASNSIGGFRVTTVDVADLMRASTTLTSRKRTWPRRSPTASSRRCMMSR